MLTVIHKNPICSFNSMWLQDIVDQYLQFEQWSSEKTYDPGTVFYTNMLDPAEIDQLIDRGFRVIIDNLWEANHGPWKAAHKVVCDRWFWYNESLWYRYYDLHQYQPQRHIQYLALMPMNRSRPHRNEFLEAVESLLPRMIWSSVEQHQRQLPYDGDMTDWNTQRKMNPEWYNWTYFSMVAESVVRPSSKYTPIFITEKTMKPLAFWHPFVVYGNRGTLRTLREWGFETFNNLWDESYDEIVDVNARRAAVVDLINSIEIRPHDQETLRRLEHNHDLFFDRETVQAGIVKEIIEPILEYAETDL